MRYTFTGRIILIICGILAVLSLYNIATSPVRLISLLIGIITLIISLKHLKKYTLTFVLVGLILIVLPILTTTMFWVLLAVSLILLIHEKEGIFYQIKDLIFDGHPNTGSREYVSFQLKDEEKEIAVRKEKKRWIGNEVSNKTFRWDHVTYNKFAGNSVIDLGNTILPKDKNYIFIRKSFGNTKILVPKEVSVSIDVNVLIGKVIIGKKKVTMTNETIYWRSKSFDESQRKLLIVESVLFGNVEVIFI